MVARGTTLRMRAKDRQPSGQIAVDFRRSGLSPRQRAMLDLAMKVAKAAQDIGEEDARDIAAFFAPSNRLADATRLRPDDDCPGLGR